MWKESRPRPWEMSRRGMKWRRAATTAQLFAPVARALTLDALQGSGGAARRPAQRQVPVKPVMSSDGTSCAKSGARPSPSCPKLLAPQQRDSARGHEGTGVRGAEGDRPHAAQVVRRAGRHAIDGEFRLVAELSDVVRTPAALASRGHHGAGEVGTRGDVARVCQHVGRGRRERVQVRPVAQLAVAVVSPAAHAARDRDDAGVLPTPRRATRRSESRRWPGAWRGRRRCRRRAGRGGWRPAAHAIGQHQRARDGAAGGNGLDAGEDVGNGRGGAVGGGAVAELAGVVGAPAADAARRRQHAGVTVAGGDGLDAGWEVGGGRGGAVGGGAVAELAGIVGAPATHAARRGERAGVVAARGDGLHPSEDVRRRARRCHAAPSPSWPASLAPQQRTPPAPPSAQVWFAPAAICVFGHGAVLLRASM